MTIRTRTMNGVEILDMKGKLMLGPDTAQLRHTIGQLLQTGHNRILVNLDQVPYMDSCGLGELVHSYKSVARRGGNLKLLSLGSRHHKLLALTKLLTVFESYDSEPEAVASFS